MIRTFRLLTLIIGFIFAGFYIVQGSGRDVTPSSIMEDKPCTFRNVYFHLKSIGVRNIRVVFAQAMLESDELNSYLAVTNNNLFGMRLPSKRETTAIGTNKGYAVFSHWTSCLEDYKIYQDSRFKKEISDIQYILRLNKYASDPNYSRKLLNFTRKYDSLYLKFETEYQQSQFYGLVSN